MRTVVNRAEGPADKGSRYCLQHWVGEADQLLADQIVACCPALLTLRPSVVWKSPLETSNWLEYRDDFLVPLDLKRLQVGLREFWPSGGPQWDGLALLSTEVGDGILLVEAKGHPEETESSCGATNAASLVQIEKAFAQTQSFMAVAPQDWTQGAYQLANRLAFLYYLNEVAKVPTFLALINFLNDCSYRPTSLTQWRQHYEHLFRHLGIHPGSRLLEKVALVYPNALPPGDVG